jgi:hypothetical protein
MKWIPVSERLPVWERVLIWTRECGCLVAGRGGATEGDDFKDGWTWDVINDTSFEQSEVTHWQPLPDPPTT